MPSYSNREKISDQAMNYIDSPEFFKFLLSYAVFFKTAYNIHYISLMETPENFTTYYNLNCFLKLTKIPTLKSIYYFNAYNILDQYKAYRYLTERQADRSAVSLVRKMHLLKENIDIYEQNTYQEGEKKGRLRIIENSDFLNDVINHTSDKTFSHFNFNDQDVQSITQFETYLAEIKQEESDILNKIFLSRSIKEINIKIIKKMNAAFSAATGHTFSSFSKHLLFWIYSNYERSMKLIPLLNKSKLLNTRAKAKTLPEHHYERLKIMTGENADMRRYSLLHMFEGYSDELIEQVKSELPKFFNSSVSLCGFYGYEQFKIYKKALFSINNEDHPDFDKNKLHTYNNRFTKKGWNFLLKQSESYIIRVHNNLSHGLFCAQNELKDAWLRNKTLNYFFNITHYFDRYKSQFLPLLLKEIQIYKGPVVHFKISSTAGHDLSFCKDYLEDKMKIQCISEAKKQLGNAYPEDFSQQANTIVKENMSYFSRKCLKNFSSFDQVQAASRKWHEEISRKREKEREKELEEFEAHESIDVISNNPMTKNSELFNNEKKCFTINEVEFFPLQNIKAVRQESELMKHCLYRSYSHSIMKHNYIAFSVLNKNEKCFLNKFPEERSTLGIFIDPIDGFNLDQIQLFDNGFCAKEAKRLSVSEETKRSAYELIKLLNTNLTTKNTPNPYEVNNNLLQNENCFDMI